MMSTYEEDVAAVAGALRKAIRQRDEAQADRDAALAKVAKMRELRDEWAHERDACIAWITDKEPVDADHPMRLSRMADILDRHVQRVTAIVSEGRVSDTEGDAR